MPDRAINQPCELNHLLKLRFSAGFLVLNYLDKHFADVVRVPALNGNAQGLLVLLHLQHERNFLDDMLFFFNQKVRNLFFIFLMCYFRQFREVDVKFDFVQPLDDSSCFVHVLLKQRHFCLLNILEAEALVDSQLVSQVLELDVAQLNDRVLTMLAVLQHLGTPVFVD